MVMTMDATVRGDLERGESWADQLVTTMRALGLSEAGVYRTTTTMALHRERGTLGDLGGLADAAEAMGHPAGPSGAIAAYIRHHRGELDAVLAALDAIEGEEFADDAGYPISAAYWAEIVAVIGNDEQRQRFLGPLGVKSGLNVGTGGIFLGPADRLRALLHDSLGDHELADERFAAAVEQLERLVSPPWTARTQLDWAESLLARGQAARARACVDSAVAAVGDLDLPDARSRIASISERLAAEG
jgi:hypothetical protein